ncbi:MAG: prolipoprotein diacylglyceryl transferase [Lachnospiraceae bacterium]
MQEAINFPHLGIHLENVGTGVSVFGFKIAYYGIIIGCALLLGILIAVAEAKRTKQNVGDYLDMSIYAILFAIVGARLYYVIFSWDTYKHHFFSIFNIRQGGLAIYGGVIAAVITIFVFAGLKKLSPWQMLDTAVLGLVMGQMLGRWGNFFNREAFGEYTNGLFAMQLPVDAVRISDITDKMRDHLVKIKETAFIQVHPTFLYESIWCLLLLIFLFFYRKKKKFEGELFLMYLFGYGVGRFWIEGLRTDQLFLFGSKVPVSQALAGIMVIVSAILIYYNRQRRKRKHLSHRTRNTHAERQTRPEEGSRKHMQ